VLGREGRDAPGGFSFRSGMRVPVDDISACHSRYHPHRAVRAPRPLGRALSLILPPLLMAAAMAGDVVAQSDAAASTSRGAELHLATYPTGGIQAVVRVFAPGGAGPHPVLILFHGFPGTREGGRTVGRSNFRRARVPIGDWRVAEATGRPRDRIGPETLVATAPEECGPPRAEPMTADGSGTASSRL